MDRRFLLLSCLLALVASAGCGEKSEPSPEELPAPSVSEAPLSGGLAELGQLLREQGATVRQLGSHELEEIPGQRGAPPASGIRVVFADGGSGYVYGYRSTKDARGARGAFLGPAAGRFSITVCGPHLYLPDAAGSAAADKAGERWQRQVIRVDQRLRGKRACPTTLIESAPPSRHA